MSRHIVFQENWSRRHRVIWLNHKIATCAQGRPSKHMTTTAITTSSSLSSSSSLVSSSSLSQCVCQPSHWEFTLDFSSSTDCTATNWQTGSGIASLACASRSTNRQSSVPTILEVVDSVTIQEFNAKHVELKKNEDDVDDESGPNVQGPFWNGESFSYTSMVSNLETTTSSSSLPSAITVHVFGVTPKQEMCEFEFTIYFSNDCNAAYPVINAGDYIGPITVVRTSFWFVPRIRGVKNNSLHWIRQNVTECCFRLSL